MAPKGRALIANIGPFEFYFSRSYGQFRILGNAKHLPYTLTVIEDKSDRIDMGDSQYLPFPIQAKDIAKDLVENEHLAAHGVFVIAGDRPTTAEIEAASVIRSKYYKTMLDQGDALWAKYHRHELIDDNSRRAAMFFGEEREWAYEIMKKIDCPGCGKKVLSSTARHECGYVINLQVALQGGMIDEATFKRLNALRKNAPKPKKAAAGAEDPKTGDDQPGDEYVDPAEEVTKT